MSSFSLVFLAISELLSMVSSAFLILIFIFKNNSRKYAFKLSLPLFIFDFIVSFSLIIPTMCLLFNPDFVISIEICYLEGAIRSFASMGECIATVNITWSLYTQIIRKKPIKKDPLKYFALFNIIPPLICAITFNYAQPFPQILCVLSMRAGPNKDYLGIVLRVLLYYIPVLGSFIFDIYAVIRVLVYLNRNKHGVYDQKHIMNIILYPIVFFISWICLIIKRISEVFDSDFLDSFNSINLSLMILNGFFNAIVYGIISINAFQYVNETNDYFDQNIDESQLLSRSQDSETLYSTENNQNYKLFLKQSDVSSQDLLSQKNQQQNIYQSTS